MKYAYRCRCGTIESETRADEVRCLACGEIAKRVWAVTLDRQSTKQSGRWDPQVGEYVANDREFQELLRQGAERQEAELGMECRLTTVDSRDVEARGELHGTGVDHIKEQAENTARKVHDEKARANGESKVRPKVPLTA